MCNFCAQVESDREEQELCALNCEQKELETSIELQADLMRLLAQRQALFQKLKELEDSNSRLNCELQALGRQRDLQFRSKQKVRCIGWAFALLDFCLNAAHLFRQRKTALKLPHDTDEVLERIWEIGRILRQNDLIASLRRRAIRDNYFQIQVLRSKQCHFCVDTSFDESLNSRANRK